MDWLPPLQTPPILHQPGGLSRVPDWLGQQHGQAGSLLLVTGETTLKHVRSLADVVELLEKGGWSVHIVRVPGEPAPDWIDAVRQRLSKNPPDQVLAVGGGSALDAGKALAALFCEQGPAQSYLEGVGDRQPSGKRLPWLAVPTTMGTGSEVTHNAVLGRSGLRDGFKRSLRHAAYAADGVVLDARLSRTLPEWTITASGMDALSQLLESYLAPTSNALLDVWLLHGLRLCGGSLPVLLRRHATEDHENARHEMALAALLSGVGLTHTGLGAVHGLIGPMGAVAPVPHGVACARVLPPVMRHSLDQARAAGREVQDWVESRMAQAAACLAGEGRAAVSACEGADILVDTLERWMADAESQGALPSLGEYGFSVEHQEAVLERASDRRNPVALSTAQRRAILEEARGA